MPPRVRLVSLTPECSGRQGKASPALGSPWHAVARRGHPTVGRSGSGDLFSVRPGGYLGGNATRSASTYRITES